MSEGMQKTPVVLGVVGVLMFVAFVVFEEKAKREAKVPEVEETVEEAPRTERVPVYKWSAYDQESGKSRALAAWRNVFKTWEDVEIVEAWSYNMVEREANWFHPDKDSEEAVHGSAETVLRLAPRLRGNQRLVMVISSGGTRYLMVLTRLRSSGWSYQQSIREFRQYEEREVSP